MDSKKTSGGVPKNLWSLLKWAFDIFMSSSSEVSGNDSGLDWIQCKGDNFCVSMVICSLVGVPVVFMGGLLLASLT